ncbi:hypothetical protein ACHAWF_004225 [Thalassiosira exigua]
MLDEFRRFRRGPLYLPSIRRVELLSDLHMDYPANQAWLHELCAPSTDEDRRDGGGDRDAMILVAGDVSHDLSVLRWTFRTLKRRYGEVSYVVGNHELWLDPGRKRTSGPLATRLDADGGGGVGGFRCPPSCEGDGCETSLDKLVKILELCDEEEVHFGPVRCGDRASRSDDVNNSSGSVGGERDGGVDGRGLWVIPLLSWHAPSFDVEPDVEGWAGIPPARKVVADYRRTRWPYPLSIADDSVAAFLDRINDAILGADVVEDVVAEGFDDDDGGEEGATTTPILTFSHFLPRVELLPEKRYLSLPTLHACVGSTRLERRVRSFSDRRPIRDEARTTGTTTTGTTTPAPATRHLHAFGHTHLSWDATLDGVRYVQAPLAYPREWEKRRRSLEIDTMGSGEDGTRRPVRLWKSAGASSSLSSKGSSDGAGAGDEPDVDAAGFPSRWLGGWWSKYYAVRPRAPERNTQLSPWTAKVGYRRLPGGTIEDFDHEEVEERYREMMISSRAESFV